MHCADVVLIGRSTCEYSLVAETGALPPEARASPLVTPAGRIEQHPLRTSRVDLAHIGLASPKATRWKPGRK